jgi:hypothetical protein
VTLLLLLARESVSIFFNKTSYIETKPLDITKRFTLSFRTCEGGSLLRQIGNNGYFELVVLPGAVDYGTNQFTESSLALRWRTAGSLNLTVLNVGNKSDQNIPYHVVFTPSTVSLNAMLSISLGSEVYVVEVPHTIYNVVGKNLTLGQGFIGCITFGDEFDVVNATKQVGTSKDCPLDGGERCNRKGTVGLKSFVTPACSRSLMHSLCTPDVNYAHMLIMHNCAGMDLASSARRGAGFPWGGT